MIRILLLGDFGLECRSGPQAENPSNSTSVLWQDICSIVQLSRVERALRIVALGRNHGRPEIMRSSKVSTARIASTLAAWAPLRIPGLQITTSSSGSEANGRVV
jgi:hypothetical protein